MAPRLASLSFKRCPQVQWTMPWFQYERHSLHCVLGFVSHNSNSSTLPMSLIIFLDFTKWVVGIILLKIGLKILSMRMVLDLLHELTNTRIFSLFHNWMWQARFFWSRCPPRQTLRMNRLSVSAQRISPFYRDLHLLLNWSFWYHERNFLRTGRVF